MTGRFGWFLAGVLLLPIPGCDSDRWETTSQSKGAGPITPLVAGDSGVMLVGAGDIAVCGHGPDQATAHLLDSLPGTIFTLGDNVYESGTAAQFRECYSSSWGRHRDRTHPAAGNHEYLVAGGSGYFGYFGSSAGNPAAGYYSYDLGAWHIVVLNSQTDVSAGSPQLVWLQHDLAASHARCTLAYWHVPRFSSGRGHGSAPAMQPTWQVLYDAGAEVVLSGHEHNYERFAPQTPTGALDTARGIREFVVGTGGATLTPFRAPLPNSEVRNWHTHGILQLVLYPGRYEWRFLPIRGQTFTDSGSGRCH